MIVPVTQALPSEDGPVLAYDANARNRQWFMSYYTWRPYAMESASFDARGFHITDDEANRGVAKTVTHWHRLPKDPT